MPVKHNILQITTHDSGRHFGCYGHSTLHTPSGEALMIKRSEGGYFLGIDAGTTSLKAALFDTTGHLLGLERQEYSLLMPAPAWVEQDLEIYWQACCRAVRGAVARSGISPKEIAALCISSQGETLIPLDAAGRPARPAIVWLDNRATEEARLIAGQFAAETVYHITGQPEVAPTWPACKLLWLRRHEPQTFERTAHWLLLEDYLLYRLTGQFVAEYSLHTSSLLLDIPHKRRWAPMLDYVGITPDQLGRLLEPGQPVGKLSVEGAEAIGLSPETVAVAGGLDQVVGAVGAGNIAPGVVTEMTGGALAIVATLDRPRFDPGCRVPCHYHARPDTYCLVPWGQTAGMALKWFRDAFCEPQVAAAAASGRDPYDEMMALASAVPPGAEGLVALPHLEGAFCPEFDPAATAVFFGVTLRHGRPHCIRAIMEAVAYMLKKNLDLIEGLGVPVREVRSIGGGARSPLWLQIKADVLQKPVITLQCEEVACLGAALMAAVASGQYRSLEEGVAGMTRLRATFDPNPAHAGVYCQGFGRYLELYDRLAPMFTQSSH